MTTSRSQGPSLLMMSVAAVVSLFFAGSALAQTTTGIPSGYQSYSGNVYYNSSLGTYYNAATGQYSSIAPSGPATTNSSGNISIPAGYTSSGNGQYYNSSTGLYYDPATGFYSASAPTNTSANTSSGTSGTGTVTNPGTINYSTTNPGIPNTGAGGAATANLILLGLALCVGSVGIVLMTRKSVPVR